jgi:hypothetical protein
MRLIKILFPLLIASLFCNAQDHADKDLFPPDLDTVRYVPYRKGKTWFYVDRQQDGPWGYGVAKAWPEEWDMAGPFNEYGIALVEKNGRLGYINKKGKLVTPLKYYGVNDVFSNGHCIMEDSLGRMEIINFKGEIVAPAKKSTNYSYVVKDVFVVYDSATSKYGLKDIYGTWRIPMGKYAALNMPSKQDTSGTITYYTFDEYEQRETWRGYMKTSGEPLTPPKFKWIGFITEGTSAYTKNGKKYGYINTSTGKLHIRPKFYFTKCFLNGIAEVKKKDKNYMQRALINKNGKELFPEVYEGYASGFNGDYILVKKNNKWGILNKEGQVTVPFIYDKKSYYKDENNMFFLSKNGKSGSTDGKGNIIIPFIYDVSKSGYPTLKWITPNLVRAQLNGKWGIIDRNNKILVPFNFPEISASILNKLHGGLIWISDDSYHDGTVGYLDLSLNQYWED